MDESMDINNLIRIHDGIFVGDLATASNLDVVVNFKITNMINATGVQKNNLWEALGLNYMTIMWSKTPQQALFDNKDEISDRIVKYIDNSYKNGALLIYSATGKTRAFIVIISYLMRK